MCVYWYMCASNSLQEINKEKQKEEQQKYGIFFDDEYDYLQHLKDLNEVYELEEHVPREEKVCHSKNRSNQKLLRSALESIRVYDLYSYH